ncbi:MAG: 2OG-Fe(II) oxygenase [Pseudomonadota bacterium]
MSEQDGIVVSKDQIAYVARELRRGVMPNLLRASLRTAKWPEEQIRALMGPAFDGVISAEDVDYEAIYTSRITALAETHADIRPATTSKAQVYTWKNFLRPEICDQLVARTEQMWRDSTVVDVFADPKIRTSKSADIGGVGDPLIFQLDQLMAEALGIHWSYSDPSQTQRYQAGQEYKAHHDYFAPGTRDYQVHCQDRGQRTWTFMVYLSDVEEGGGTRFRKLEKTFMPKKGSAVIWNNLNRDGSVNPWTLHHGMKVRQGTKYIVTKWFRERGWGPMRFSDREEAGTIQAQR